MTPVLPETGGGPPGKAVAATPAPAEATKPAVSPEAPPPFGASPLQGQAGVGEAKPAAARDIEAAARAAEEERRAAEREAAAIAEMAARDAAALRAAAALLAAQGGGESAAATFVERYGGDGRLEAAIAVLEAEAGRSERPRPELFLALAACYGRKGLSAREYLALERVEEAARSQPQLAFSLAAVYGRKDMLKAGGGIDELFCSLALSSEPAGATAFLDGIRIGATPCEAKLLRTGSHALRLELEDYSTLERDISLATGRNELRERLASAWGSIAFSFNPGAPKGAATLEPGGRVWNFNGPFSTSVERLRVGTYTLAVTKLGIKTPFTYRTRIIVGPGPNPPVRVDFDKDFKMLVLRSEPPGAKVRIDDEPAGRTPLSNYPIHKGSRLISVELEGYETWTTTLEVAGEGIPDLNVTLKPR